MSIGFLHTSNVHVPTFDALLSQADRAAGSVHVVDESLLEQARTGGLTDELRERVFDRLTQLASASEAILCTCSTIGAVAESFSDPSGVPVVRIDRPLARAALRRGRRIAIVTAVESTIVPTRELFGEEARALGVDAEIVDVPCLSAWRHFESGDLDRYLTEIAEHVDRSAPTFDVVVLAQASMAPAGDHCTTQVPVLASPALAVQAVLEAAGGAPR